MKYKKSEELIIKEAKKLLKDKQEIKIIAETIVDESDGDIKLPKANLMADKIHKAFYRELFSKVIDGIRNGYAGRNGEQYGKVNRTRIGIWIQFELDKQHNKTGYR